jgi:inosine-uridine nucleoside N-ribohydrolase
MAEIHKVILDTDIGSDIDDATCLAYLLAHPRCELLGITTVSGSSLERARLASALCTLADADDIPILRGLEAPLLVDQRQPVAPQAAALERWPHRSDFPEHEAVTWMRETIRAYPGEVTLLAIGPLTNIATLFTVDPEIPSLVKSLVLMAGSVAPRNARSWGGPVPEWNVLCDPHAAAIVFRATVADFQCYGYDVTTEVVLPAAAVRERFTAPLLRPVADFAEVWFAGGGDGIMFHDPLAAAAIFDPQIVELDRGRITVETDSTHLRGVTRWQPDPAGNVRYAMSVNAPAFFAEYFSVFEDASVRVPK